MKFKSVLSAMVGMTLAAFGAEVGHAALSSSIRVRVRNSANYVYPCNAGIAQNPKSLARGVDYIRGSWVASEHNPTAHSGTGIAIGGIIKDNFPDTDFPVLLSLFTGARSYLSYNQLLPENAMYDQIVGQGTDGRLLEINLASDTYDAGYYVTFCFKPSMIDEHADGVPMTLKFTSARATHSVVPGSPYNYATDAALRAMLEIKCTKDSGRTIQHYTPGGLTNIDSLLTPFTGNTMIDLIPVGGIAIGSGSSLVSGPALASGELPSECRIRYYFIETSAKLRPHTLTSSDIQLDLDAAVGTVGGGS